MPKETSPSCYLATICVRFVVQKHVILTYTSYVVIYLDLPQITGVPYDQGLWTPLVSLNKAGYETLMGSVTGVLGWLAMMPWRPRISCLPLEAPARRYRPDSRRIPGWWLLDKSWWLACKGYAFYLYIYIYMYIWKSTYTYIYIVICIIYVLKYVHKRNMYIFIQAT